MEYIKFSTFRKDYLDKYLAQIFGLNIFRKLKHVAKASFYRSKYQTNLNQF